MKAILPFCFLFISYCCLAQPPEGAWRAKKGSSEALLVFVDGYLSYTLFDKANQRFEHTFGGPYSISADTITFLYEYHSANSSLVGKEGKVIGHPANGTKVKVDGEEQEWTPVDQNENPIAGVWWISGRMQGEEIVARELRDRRTLKILSGTRFQWVAINIKTGEFSGTGGGTFQFVDGRYTEHIEFFSRDASRVGASLSFNGELKDGEWHHSGTSSAGAPIYEIWSKLGKATK